MRHLSSTVVSLLITPVGYALTGIGLVYLAVARTGSALDVVEFVVGVLALLGAGLLYSVLTLARFSPVGTTLAGVALFAVGAWAEPPDLDATVKLGV